MEDALGPGEVLRRQLAVSAPEDDPPPRIASVGIPTRDRPATLRRCLASLIACARRHGRIPELVVVDDSDGEQAQDGNRQLLRSLAAGYGPGVFYAGPRDRARFAEMLVQRTGLPPDVVRFGLLGGEPGLVTTGAARNALLLHTAGSAVLQVDDDTVWRVTPAPGAQTGLALSSRHDPTDFWFFAEGAPAPADDLDGGADLLAVHERLLGRGPAGWLAGLEAGAPLDAGQANAGFFRKLGARGGRVLATAAGVAGDSGMGSSLYLLALEGGSRDRLLVCERDYRHAVTAHQVVRAVTRTTVCEGAFCMALNLGLDNRQLLPPFLPAGRNQDGVFGALLRSCFGGAYFGFLPWLLPHRPPAPRRWPEEAFWARMTRWHTGQVVQALVRSFAPAAGSADGGESLRALGAALAGWGLGPRADAARWLRRQWEGQVSRQAAHLEGRLRQVGGPDYWVRDVRRLVAALRASLVDPQGVLPWDLVEAFGADAALPRLQRLAARFGRLLQCWPDLVEAAKELAARGLRLAGKV